MASDLFTDGPPVPPEVADWFPDDGTTDPDPEPGPAPAGPVGPAAGRFVQTADGWHVEVGDLAIRPDGTTEPLHPVPRLELRISFAGLTPEAAARHFAALVPWAEALFEATGARVPECWHLHAVPLDDLLCLMLWDNATVLQPPEIGSDGEVTTDMQIGRASCWETV